MTLEQALDSHKQLHEDLGKAHRDMLQMQHAGNSLNKEIQAIMKPYELKGKKLEIKINNKANYINSIMIKKYEAEGIIKHLGGIIPEQYKSPTIPDLPELEDDLLHEEPLATDPVQPIESGSVIPTPVSPLSVVKNEEEE